MFPPQVKYGVMSGVRPRWAGSSQVLQPDGSLLVGGGFLSATDFPENPPGSGLKFVSSGVLIGRTFAERDANVGYGMGDPVADDELALLYFDVENALVHTDCELYKPSSGLVVFENFLPEATRTNVAAMTWIRSNYLCRLGMP